MSLEEAADNTKVMTTNRITRVGLQDDVCAVADPEDFTILLEELQIELQACGHRLRMHKCEVWFPGWDDTSDDDLPRGASGAAEDPARDWRLGAIGSGCAWRLVCSDRTGAGVRKGQADHTHDEAT